METQNNRAALDRHWAASASGDLDAEHQIYDDNIICEYALRPADERGNAPLIPTTATAATDGEIICRERLGGVLRHYYRAAAA
jgi:hypothetical protein